MTRRIGIMGGTFNPIHNGHLNIIRQAREQFGLDEVWLMPTGESPHKGITDSLGRYDRLHMCQLAVQGMRGVKVSDLEIRRSGKSYTYLSLKELRQRFSDDSFYYIIGEDSLDLFFSWVHPERICAMATILIACRSPEETLHAITVSQQISRDQAAALTRRVEKETGAATGAQDSFAGIKSFQVEESRLRRKDLQKKIKRLSDTYQGSFHILDCGQMDISSTQIRRMVAEKEDISAYTPAKVVDYIRTHALYQNVTGYDIVAIEKSLQGLLSPHRYAHTLGVMHTACALSMAHSYPMTRAQIAGLLHDCAKYLSNDQLIEIAKKRGLSISPGEEKAPQLLHAKVGALFAEEIYGVQDPAVLRAIRLHTTGSPAMGLLDKIIFVADYIEPGRDRAPHLSDIRQLAFYDLDLAVTLILEDTIAFLEASGAEIDISSRQTLDSYRDIIQTRRFQS
nr:nicotinate (nicotinamide) nucleotide adenylyltransferase [uncultured Shuttleworthia sp.]